MRNGEGCQRNCELRTQEETHKKAVRVRQTIVFIRRDCQSKGNYEGEKSTPCECGRDITVMRCVCWSVLMCVSECECSIQGDCCKTWKDSLRKMARQRKRSTTVTVVW